MSDDDTCSSGSEHTEQSFPYEWRSARIGGDTYIIRDKPSDTVELFVVTDRKRNVRSLVQADSVLYEGNVVFTDYVAETKSVAFIHDWAGRLDTKFVEDWLERPVYRLTRIPTDSSFLDANHETADLSDTDTEHGGDAGDE